jgi:hypothetical protein
MCRIPKVLIVAPADKQADLRRALSSLEYDIVAAVATADDAREITADAAVVWEPDAATIEILKQRGVKTAAVGSEPAAADMHLEAEEIAQFKTRVWELFAPS